MRARLAAALALVALVPGCSDQGTVPEFGWLVYDLPYAQISLPPQLEQEPGIALFAENPEVAGVVERYPLTVQICIYQPALLPRNAQYGEETVWLWGKRAVLFRGLGALHAHDSHLSCMTGIRAAFKPDGGFVEVVIGAQREEAYGVARRILMTMRPAPWNTGGPL
jgi:hypothetical protein